MVKTLCVVTCPQCATEHREQMPMNGVTKQYDCRQCGHHLHVEDEECCVFCVYGSRRCLARQREWRDNANKAGSRHG